MPEGGHRSPRGRQGGPMLKETDGRWRLHNDDACTVSRARCGPGLLRTSGGAHVRLSQPRQKACHAHPQGRIGCPRPEDPNHAREPALSGATASSKATKVVDRVALTENAKHRVGLHATRLARKCYRNRRARPIQCDWHAAPCDVHGHDPGYDQRGGPSSGARPSRRGAVQHAIRFRQRERRGHVGR